MTDSKLSAILEKQRLEYEQREKEKAIAWKKHGKNREVATGLGLIIPEEVEFDLNRECAFEVQNNSNQMYGFRVHIDDINELFHVKKSCFVMKAGETRKIEAIYLPGARLPADSEYFLKFYYSPLNDQEEAEEYIIRDLSASIDHVGPIRCYVTFARSDEDKNEEKKPAQRYDTENLKKKSEESTRRAAKQCEEDLKFYQDLDLWEKQKSNAKSEKPMEKSSTENPENSTVKSSKIEKSATENTKTQKSTLRSSKTTAATSEIQSKSGIEEKEKSQKVEKPPKKKNPCCVII